MDAAVLGPVGLVATSSDIVPGEIESDPPGKRRTMESKLAVLELARQLGSVSRACEVMGFSRDSFYRFKRLYESGGKTALQPISRREPILTNRVAPEIEQAAVMLALEEPTWGQARVAAELRQRGFSISAAGVRCVWLRNDLQTIALRLRAIEVMAARRG